jgi:hypothetical protein
VANGEQFWTVIGLAMGADALSGEPHLEPATCQSRPWNTGKRRPGEEMAEAMGHAPARFAMLEIAQLYRNLAEQTRKLTEAREAGAR